MTTDQINARIDAAIEKLNNDFATAMNTLESLKQDMIKDVKPQLRTGEWYESDKGHLFYLTEIRRDTSAVNPHKSYGFTSSGDWDNEAFRSLYKSKEATLSKVVEALKNEAVKRGIVPGVTLERSHLIYNNGNVTIVKSGFQEWTYDKRLDMLQHYGLSVYEKGIWATPITPVKEKTTEDYCNEFYNTAYTPLGDFLKNNNLKITPND